MDDARSYANLKVKMRSGRKCAICGEKMEAGEESLEHFFPRALYKWGENILPPEEYRTLYVQIESDDNIIFTHLLCNGAKEDAIIDIAPLHISGEERKRLLRLEKKIAPVVIRYRSMKSRLYEKQEGKCYCCHKEFGQEAIVLRRKDPDLLRVEENACLVCHSCNLANPDYVSETEETSGKSRLDKQFEFILETDKEKFVTRQTYLSDANRKENDAEHSWHMALMTILLSEYANEKIDVLKTVTMLLIHDLVEIYAGDTYAYDESGKQTQKERETEAAKRLYQILPKDQEENLKGLWEEFEAGETPEARFARTMDNLQPMMLNSATDGKSWTEHGVHISQILKRNQRTEAGSKELWEYAKENFLKPHIEAGHIKTDGEDL